MTRRTRRFSFVIGAGILLLVALKSAHDVPAEPRVHPPSDDVPDPARDKPPSRDLRQKPRTGVRRVHLPHLGVALLAALVLVVGTPAEAAPVLLPSTTERSFTPPEDRRASSPPRSSRTTPTPAGTAATQEDVPKLVPASAEVETRTVVRRPPASQRTATLLAPQAVFSKPSRPSARLGLVRAHRPLTGARTVLPVISSTRAARGIRWLRVKLPGRPNGRSGWIRERATVRSSTGWHILVDTSERRVTIYRAGRLQRVVAAVVGTSSTPTPHGTFFVEEAIQLRAWDVGAPYALALSARSNVLQQFNGGPGQIALHGLANVGGVLGTAGSHGCLRLDNGVMSWLVHRIGPGVPVTITA